MTGIRALPKVRLNAAQGLIGRWFAMGGGHLYERGTRGFGLLRFGPGAGRCGPWRPRHGRGRGRETARARCWPPPRRRPPRAGCGSCGRAAVSWSRAWHSGLSGSSSSPSSLVSARPSAPSFLAGAAAPAGLVLAPGGSHRARGQAAEGGFAVLHGIYWLATNLAQARPITLLVDDLHWVDPSSIRALAYLAHRIADLPIAIVVALRPDEPGSPVALLDELRAEPEAVRITVPSLRLGAVAAIVRAAIADADDALCAACYSATAGNPFYLRELLFTIAAEQHGEVVPVVREVSVPALADRAVRRLSRIGPETVSLARAMAILGEGSSLADAAALAGLDELQPARRRAPCSVSTSWRRPTPFRSFTPSYAAPCTKRSQSLNATPRTWPPRGA